MKHNRNISVLMVIAILAGFLSSTAPVVAETQTASPKMAVFEIVTSPT